VEARLVVHSLETLVVVEASRRRVGFANERLGFAGPRALRDWARLLRVTNVALAVLATELGFEAVPGPSSWRLHAGALFALALLVAAANVHNDLVDVEIDRLNRPTRPLASGALSRRAATFAAVLLYAGFVLVSVWLGFPQSCLLAAMGVSTWAYNTRLKHMPLSGNVCVALLCALAVYFAEFPAWPHHTVPAIGVAFLITLTRELLKDIEDIPGDRAAGARTLPIVLGVDAALRTVQWLIAISLSWLVVPVVFFRYGPVYVSLALVGVTLPLLSAIRALHRSGVQAVRPAQKRLKCALAGAILAVMTQLLTWR